MAMQSAPHTPDTFVLTVINPAAVGCKRGLQVSQQLVPYQRSTVQVRVEGSTWVVTTSNVRRLLVSTGSVQGGKWVVKSGPSSGSVQGLPSDGILLIDGQTFAAVDLSRGDSLCVNDTGTTLPMSPWRVCKASLLERSPLNYGPLRQVFERRFVILYGSGNEEHRRMAVFLSNLFHLTSDARAEVRADSDADIWSSELEGYNIVLIGGTAANKWTYTVANTAASQVAIQDSHIRVGPCHFEGAGIGVAALLPLVHPDCTTHEASSPSSPSTSMHCQEPALSRTALLLAATDLQGLRTVLSLANPTISPMVLSYPVPFIPLCALTCCVCLVVCAQ